MSGASLENVSAAGSGRGKEERKKRIEMSNKIGVIGREKNRG